MKVASIRYGPMRHKRCAEPLPIAPAVAFRPTARWQRRDIRRHTPDKTAPLQAMQEGGKLPPSPRIAAAAQASLQCPQRVRAPQGREHRKPFRIDIKEVPPCTIESHPAPGLAAPTHCGPQFERAGG